MTSYTPPFFSFIPPLSVDMLFVDPAPPRRAQSMSPPKSPTFFVKAIAKPLRIGDSTALPPGILCSTTDPNVSLKKDHRGTIAYRKDGSVIGVLLPGVHYKLSSSDPNEPK